MSLRSGFLKSRKKRLKHFIYDGVGASICEGMIETNFSTLALALLATASQIGFLASAQSFFGCILQLWGEQSVAFWGSRKKLVLFLVGVQILVLILMSILTFTQSNVILFLGLILIYTVAASVSSPPWSAWVSDLLPSRRRGLCFGIRNQRVLPTQFVSVLLAGLILYLSGRSGSIDLAPNLLSLKVKLAFCSVIWLSLGAKIFSWVQLAWQPEKPFKIRSAGLGPVEFILSSLRDKTIRKTTYLWLAVAFAVQISMPFQTTYILQTLHMSYFQFAIISAMGVGSRFFAVRMAGRSIDRIGSKSLLVLACLMMPWVALGWCMLSSFMGVLIVQLISGIIWAAFDLCAFTFLAENTSPEMRQRAFGVKHFAWNFASSMGALLGGVLCISFTHPQAVFWASFGARILAALVVVKVLDPRLEQGVVLTQVN